MERGDSVCQWGASEVQETSALADFDAGEVLDILSTGILVLDDQLCVVYANPTAEGLLMMRVGQLRGRPLPGLLREPALLSHALQEALDVRDAVCVCDFAIAGEASSENHRECLRVSLLQNQVARNYLLLQLGRCGDV